MSDKYYRLKKDTFLWREGAILKFSPSLGRAAGYLPIEDIWNTTGHQTEEYISAPIIEHPDNAEYFERVYPNTLGGKLFHTKDQLLEIYNKSFK